MYTATAVMSCSQQSAGPRRELVEALLGAGVQQAFLIGPRCVEPPAGLNTEVLTGEQPFSGALWQQVLDATVGDALVYIDLDAEVTMSVEALRRLVAVAVESAPGLAYSDGYTEASGTLVAQNTIDYQLGSLRDDFCFGPVMVFPASRLKEAARNYGPLMPTAGAALYDLRLRVSIGALPLHLPEQLYCCRQLDGRTSGQQLFDYVDPRYRQAQIEREQVVTEHLKRIGAWLPAEFKKLPKAAGPFPVEASVIIPVRNRETTVVEAVCSALDQTTDFPFNVIVVDNHSTDATTAALRELARSRKQLVHLIPERHDLGIGGCWGLAARSPQCGRYAVQLDSDDVYADSNTLQRMVDVLREGYPMVVGSYKLVNYEFKEMPPGLIDHREWTRENGANNALRINGLGAPRGFEVDFLRQIGIPNVSYGEDYALGLRISREYEIGRIYDSLYLCRRWEGNTDSDLAPEVKNRHNTYKDRLRTVEVLARQQLNEARGRV